MPKPPILFDSELITLLSTADGAFNESIYQNPAGRSQIQLRPVDFFAVFHVTVSQSAAPAKEILIL